MFLFIAFVLCIVNVFAIQSDMVFNQEIIDYVNVILISSYCHSMLSFYFYFILEYENLMDSWS